MQDIVIIYFGDYWEQHRCRRRQQLALRLAKRKEVKKLLYIELPVSFGELIKILFKRGTAHTTERWRRFLKIGQRWNFEKVDIFTPICLAPFFRFRVRTDKLFVLKQEARIIKNLLQRYPEQKIVFWFSHPFSAQILDQYEPDLLIYDYTEDFRDFEEWGEGVRNIAGKNDAKLTQESDLIFVQTTTQLKKKKTINTSTFLVQNGANIQRSSETEKVGDMLIELPKPVFGIVGTFDNRVDTKLLLSVSEEYPNASLVLIGNVRKNGSESIFNKLQRIPNIHLWGSVRYNEILPYIKAMDICLMPYQKMDYLGNPSKLYDYFLAGRPVVTTVIPGIYQFEDMVYIADTSEKFVTCIEKAIKEDSPEKETARRIYATANSWEEREKYVWQKISTKMNMAQ